MFGTCEKLVNEWILQKKVQSVLYIWLKKEEYSYHIIPKFDNWCCIVLLHFFEARNFNPMIKYKLISINTNKGLVSIFWKINKC